MRLASRLRPLRRLRILLATRPLAYWSLVALVAAGSGVVVQRVTTAAAEARRQWGEAQPTLVATRALAVGDALDATSAEVRAVPVGVRPDTALDALPPGGGVVTAPLARGEIVTAARLGRGGRSGLAALLPDGSRGVAVPISDGAVPLQAGDVVDVVGPDLLVGGTRVVRVAGDAAVVAVPGTDAAPVARAVADGQVTLVLVP